MSERDQPTINGLLRKREELLRENIDLRERMANDIEAIDRVLDTFGYQGELVPRLRSRSWRVLSKNYAADCAFRSELNNR